MIVDFLTENSILTMGMREEIDRANPTTAKVRQLLNIIQRRGPLAFQTFVDSLLACQATLPHVSKGPEPISFGI